MCQAPAQQRNFRCAKISTGFHRYCSRGSNNVPIGIRPINDFAFKKIFGSPANKLALISLLNAILGLSRPIVDVTIENPFNLQDYHVEEKDLPTARLLDCWLFWLLHAHEYEPAELLKLFPQAAIRLATQTITKIAEATEDKAMYDSREKAIRDRQWALNASRREGLVEGKIEGEIRTIRLLQEILKDPVSSEADLEGKTLEELRNQTSDLQDLVRNRHSS